MHTAEQFDLLELPAEGRWAAAWRETKAEWNDYMADAEAELGLVPKAVAARMLGVSRQRIHQLLVADKLTSFSHFDSEFVSLREVRDRFLTPKDKGGYQSAS